ncbi:DUF4906 domain-containing protein [Segatella paludivivens]|uniref:DUF4906 domain-containing protein n=1 Tax=Segatella paludivivens TaxID=185294 RepID=UPI0003A3B056|nr:fimbrial protein [Segatella paludivivens]
MNKYHTLYSLSVPVLLLSLCLFLSSCAGEDITSTSQNSGDKTMVKLSFCISDGNQTRAITSVNENIVSDITVLIFDSNNSLIGSQYLSSVSAGTVSVPVTTRSATGCTIYAIANTGSSSYFAGVNTIAKLNTMYTTIASADALESNGSTAGSTGALMIGKAFADITTGGANQFSISLYHQCGKFTFNINPGSGVTVTGYQLCNVPLSSYITDSHVPTLASTVVGPPAGSGSYGSFAAVSGLTNTASFSKTYYIYENLCGSNINATSEALRNSSNAPVSSSASASYLLINAKGNGWSSTYRVYLGGMTNATTPATDLTNFNVYRNLNYNCIITLGPSGGDGDTRVVYQVISNRSNMYMGDATVGNYLYNDGTNGTTFKSGQTVGIIYSSELTQTQYNAGCRHGRVMALKNANGGNSNYWSSNYNSPYINHSSTGHPYTTDFKTSYGDVSSGYDAMSASRSYVGTSSNYAWYYCKNYNDGIPSKSFVNAPNNVGVWYLPSAGDWWDIMENLGTWTAAQKTTIISLRSSSLASVGNHILESLNGTYFSTLNSKLSAAGGDVIVPSSGAYYFWTSSENSSSSAERPHFTAEIIYWEGYDKMITNGYLRSVLAF